MAPMRIRDEAGMNNTVLAKRTAVEVIVVKPKTGDMSGYTLGDITKRRTIGEEEPSRKVLEGVPQFLDFRQAEHFP